MPAIYLDRSAGTSFSTVQRVTVDEVDLTNWQGTPVKSLPRQVVCETGRVLGSDRRYAHAKLTGHVADMTAAECRALAASLLVAADVLEGQQEAAEITRERERYEAERRRSEEAQAAAARRLAEEGVDIVCVGCGGVKRVLPERVGDWLKDKPCCCRKRNRAYTLAPIPASVAIPHPIAG